MFAPGDANSDKAIVSLTAKTTSALPT